MILPTKHLSVQESFLGSGAAILKELSKPQTVSRLWDQVRNNPIVGNFGRFSLTLTFLFAIDAIEFSDLLIKRKGRNE